jgi:diguanylate cyclase (GGDEF)-like protein
MDEQKDRVAARRSRRQFFVRVSVFVALGAVGEALGALPPGPVKPGFYWASVAVFAATALCIVVPWRGLPRWAVLVPTFGYLASVSLLLISGGGTASAQNTTAGLGAFVLLPVLAMALYFPPSYSALAIGGSMVSLAVAGAVADVGVAASVRRLLLWAAVSAVVAVTVHRLRDSLEGEVRDSTELARLGRLMNGATQSLTSLRDPKDVLSEGVKVMAELAGSDCTRSSYLRVRDGVIAEEAVADELGSVPSSILLRDDPYVRQVVGTGQPMVAALDVRAMGPTLRSLVEDTGVTHAAYIPIAPNGELHGIATVDSRGTPISEEVFARCRALGNVVELALANALAHHELEIQANTDPLTGLANRRGLALYLEGDRALEALGILVLDIDGLKGINDAYGHDVGDKVLVGVARAASGSLRAGDLLARIGGDEFVAVVADADDSDARRVSERITEAISRLRVQDVRVSVSVGWACCGKNGDVDHVRQLADEAMYQAKRVTRRQHARHRRPPADASRSPAAAPEWTAP